MDATALWLLKVLTDDSRDENGVQMVDMNTRMKAFDKAQAWIASRRKFVPDGDDESDDEGIVSLQEFLKNPAEVVTMITNDTACFAELRARGWLPPPPKVNGRPTRAAADAKGRYEKRKAGAETGADENDDCSDLTMGLMQAGVIK